MGVWVCVCAGVCVCVCVHMGMYVCASIPCTAAGIKKLTHQQTSIDTRIVTQNIITITTSLSGVSEGVRGCQRVSESVRECQIMPDSVRRCQRVSESVRK
jgi:hypothetical protein